LKTLLALSIIFALLLTTLVSASAQQPQLASYRETAHILVDEKVQNKTTAFVTLASTSPVEMRVPTDLILKIQNTVNVTSVVITNAESCIVGVQDQGCVLVNIVSPSLVETYDINKIQANAKQVGDSLIDSINKAFATNAQFNSVYVNPRGDLSSALGTSGAVSGNRTISVIYTMSRPDSSYLFEGLTAILIPKQIRDDGGFFNVAQKMAQDSNSTVTFVITPGQGTSLYQLQVSKQVPITGPVTKVKPLELFGVDKLQRSTYFDVGFFPLNSILDVTAISNDNISITNHGGNLAPSEIKDSQKFPTDLTKSGWIIDPDYGQKVSAVYLFGKDTLVTSDQAFLTLGNTMPTDNTSGQDNTTSPTSVPKTSDNYSIYVLIGIVAAGGAAVYLFMKRR
jgi:LPXTG-motif cell wall-anchored protein